MRIHIFDVEHGACNVIETPNNQLIMIDCGHNSTTGWRPSNWIVRNNYNMANLTVSNIDEDHVSDLINIDYYCQPQTFKTNWNLTPDWIERKKNQRGGIGDGVRKVLQYLRTTFAGDSVTIDYGLERQRFCLSTSQFDDFNNLSLVTFFFYAGIGIVFPGDLEKAGWEKHLENPDFVACLKRTTLFVASHHGRIGGYSEKVFTHFKPAIVIISDKPVEHDTQAHSKYSAHPTGINFGNEVRKVLTTRNDGKITIDITPQGSCTVNVS